MDAWSPTGAVHDLTDSKKTHSTIIGPDQDGIAMSEHHWTIANQSVGVFTSLWKCVAD